MAHGEGALSGDVAVGLVQSGGIAGREFSGTVRSADLSSTDADHLRELVEQVLTEHPQATEGGPMYDGLEYELTVSRQGTPDRQIVTRDGALTAAQRELIGVLRPHLTPG